MGASRRADGQESRPDDRGVSKVVGVVLMVAIVIALASTVAVMVTGFGGMLSDPAPQASFEFTYYENVDNPQDRFDDEIHPDADEVVAIKHIGGDNIDPDSVEVLFRVTSDSGDVIERRTRWSETDTGQNSPPSVTGSMYPYAGGTNSFRGGNVTVIWSDPATDNSFILAEWEAPERAE